MKAILPTGFAFLGLCLLLISCESKKTEEPGAKIKFDADVLNAQGLRGAPDGLQSLYYKFCVPREEEKMEQVKRIDPSIRFEGPSADGADCSKEEVLAIGNTHQSNFKEILFNIADLDYVDEIREVHFE